ncbi:MAG: hypothetical protein DWQ10_11960 [Calditrichaeota bacterium]|nr:MAG: hypothetical protein DWQ10_11960 [Calditrichota bacterium]
MKLTNKFTWIGILILSLMFIGCDQDLPDKLYDPDAATGDTPVLTSIVPDGKPLAGVGRLTVTGENFSSVPEENFLYFDGVEATILSASPTELYVVAPDVVGDSVVVKAAVFRVELFSNEIIYQLIPAVSMAGDILEPGTETNQGYALAVDVNDIVYVQTDPKKIKKIAPDGTTTDFATTTYVAATSMKFGPGGILYASAPAGRVRKIVQYDQAGNESIFTTFPSAPEDFDFDAAGDILAAVGADIYRVKPDKSKAVIGSFPGDVTTLRLFNGQLYALEKANDTGAQKIWTATVQESSLENITEIYDSASSGVLSGTTINAMLLTETGDMVFGTDYDENGMFQLTSDGTVTSVYPELLSPEITALSWGNSTSFYALRDVDGNTTVLRVDMDTVLGAPYAGRQQ